MKCSAITSMLGMGMPCVEKYKKMVQKWNDLGKKYQYPKEAILEILNA